ncbi:MAG: hypothetical protein QG670_1909 [Thermoproteota archaeon]|nr:hypothetical protein [Thermoproteota archaeon]
MRKIVLPAILLSLSSLMTFAVVKKTTKKEKEQTKQTPGNYEKSLPLRHYRWSSRTEQYLIE